MKQIENILFKILKFPINPTNSTSTNQNSYTSSTKSKQLPTPTKSTIHQLQPKAQFTIHQTKTKEITKSLIYQLVDDQNIPKSRK